MKPLYKLISVFSLLVLLFSFGFSVRLNERDSEKKSFSLSLPSFSPFIILAEGYLNGHEPWILLNDPNRITISGPEKTRALTEDQWLFVRQSTTWANNNSTVVDKILSSLKKSGILAKTGTFTKSDLVINGITYKMKVESGNCTSCNVSSTTYTGSKTFRNRFKMWRSSDNKEALELLFDSAESIGASGVLLNYRLGVIGPENSNNEELIVESYIFGSSPSRKQTYTWNAPFWIAPSEKALTTSTAGRVVLEEMSFGLVGGGTVSGLGETIVALTN